MDIGMFILIIILYVMFGMFLSVLIDDAPKIGMAVFWPIIIVIVGLVDSIKYILKLWKK